MRRIWILARKLRHSAWKANDLEYVVVMQKQSHHSSLNFMFSPTFRQQGSTSVVLLLNTRSFWWQKFACRHRADPTPPPAKNQQYNIDKRLKNPQRRSTFRLVSYQKTLLMAFLICGFLSASVGLWPFEQHQFLGTKKEPWNQFRHNLNLV